MLTDKRYNMNEWNNVVMPLVESGKLVQATGYMEERVAPIYRVFRAMLKDVATGKWYRATGWAPPSGEPYVEVSAR